MLFLTTANKFLYMIYVIPNINQQITVHNLCYS